MYSQHFFSYITLNGGYFVMGIQPYTWTMIPYADVNPTTTKQCDSGAYELYK